MFDGAQVEASFQIDVIGNTINSISGLFELDGTTANILSIFNNSGGSTFRRFSVRFNDIGIRLDSLGGVRVDELAFRMAFNSGDTFEDAFEDAVGDNSTFFRAAVTSAHQQTNNSIRFYRGFLDVRLSRSQRDCC